MSARTDLDADRLYAALAREEEPHWLVTLLTPILIPPTITFHLDGTVTRTPARKVEPVLIRYTRS